MTTNIRARIGQSIETFRKSDASDLVGPLSLLLAPKLILLLFVFTGSMLLIVLFSFQDPSVGNANLSLTEWTLDNYASVLTDDLFISIISNTLQVSLITTVAAFVFSYPAAYALAMKIDRFKLVFLIAIILPLITSINIRVFGWVLMLTNKGILSGVMGAVGVDTLPQLMFQKWTIILGTTYVYLPFMLFPIYISFANIDTELVEAARDLGASRTQIFRRVIFPQSKPGIMIGTLFVFVLSLGAHIETTLLGGERIMTISSDIAYSFGYAQNWQIGSVKAISVLVVALASGIVILRTVDLEEIALRS